jgi:hypothetical protein
VCYHTSIQEHPLEVDVSGVIVKTILPTGALVETGMRQGTKVIVQIDPKDIHLI